MAQAKIDNNRVATIIGVSSADSLTPVNILVDAITGRMKVDAIVEESGHATIGDGLKAVTTAGTRVALAAVSTPCKRVIIQAHESNTGNVVVGSSTVVAALGATRRGIVLYPTNTIELKVTDLASIYIDSTVNGDSVHYYYEV